MSYGKRIVFISIAVLAFVFGLPAQSQADDPTPDPVVKELIDQLRTGNPKDRKLAAAWLGIMGDRSAIPALIDQLGPQYPDVADMPMVSLGWLEAKQAIAPLVKILAEGDANAGLPASYALGRIGDRKAVGLLMEGLRRCDPRQTSRISSLLYALGWLGTAGEARTILHQDEFSHVRGVSTRADVSEAILRMGGRGLEQDFLELLEGKWSSYGVDKGLAIRALGWIRSRKAVEPLTEILADSNADIYQRRAVLSSLEQIATPEAIKAIRMQLLADNEAVARQAVESLGTLRDRASADAVFAVAEACLTDEDDRSKSRLLRESVRALIRMGDPRGLDIWKKNPRRFGTSRGRSLAYAIGESGLKEAPEALGRIVSERLDHEKQFAAIMLGRLKARSQVPALLKALPAAKSRTRSAICKALGDIGDSRATSALVKVLEDPNSHALWNASMIALGKIADRNAIPALRRKLNRDDPRRFQYAAVALHRCGDANALPEVIAAMGAEDWKLRWQAIRAAGQMGDVRALPVLRKQLASPVAIYRTEAATALGDIGDANAIPDVRKLLEDRNFRLRAAAADALGKLGDTPSLDRLRKMLASGDTIHERAAAADALVQLDPNAAPGEVLEKIRSAPGLHKMRLLEALRHDTPAARKALKAVLDLPDADIRRSARDMLDKLTPRHTRPRSGNAER
ncbi:MAG: HEAT repeat domain-containing protein [Phycisphaerae bacterium]